MNVLPRQASITNLYFNSGLISSSFLAFSCGMTTRTCNKICFVLCPARWTSSSCIWRGRGRRWRRHPAAPGRAGCRAAERGGRQWGRQRRQQRHVGRIRPAARPARRSGTDAGAAHGPQDRHLAVWQYHLSEVLFFFELFVNLVVKSVGTLSSWRQPLMGGRGHKKYDFGFFFLLFFKKSREMVKINF